MALKPHLPISVMAPSYFYRTEHAWYICHWTLNNQYSTNLIFTLIYCITSVIVLNTCFALCLSSIIRIIFITAWTRPFLGALRLSIDWVRLAQIRRTLNFVCNAYLSYHTCYRHLNCGVAKSSKRLIRITSRGPNLMCWFKCWILKLRFFSSRAPVCTQFSFILFKSPLEGLWQTEYA